jgi:hypothetical protein
MAAMAAHLAGRSGSLPGRSRLVANYGPGGMVRDALP